MRYINLYIKLFFEDLASMLRRKKDGDCYIYPEFLAHEKP